MTDEGRVQLIEVRLTELERDVSKISMRLDTYAENTDHISNKIDEIRDDISELLTLWRNAKGFGNVGRVFGNFVKWAATIVIAIAGAWAVIVKGLKL